MPAPSITRQHAASSQTATGVPPVPPEGSPKADQVSDHSRTERTTSNRSTTRGRKDVRQDVTDRIVAMLEKGTAVFRARWSRAAKGGMPRNGKTGQPYHGANVLLLWDAAIEAGYASNIWLTYKQAASLGGQVRRGEHAVMCVHFERRTVKSHYRASSPDSDHNDIANTPADSDEDNDTTRALLLCRPFYVFNLAQIDGLPAMLTPTAEETPVVSRPVARAMRLILKCKPVIRYGFDQAMYVPSLDEIRLPWTRQFISSATFCATAMHELVHWSGSNTRLNRQFGQRFGDAAYAFEELVAELGSAFLMGHVGLVDVTLEGHAAYLQSWLQVLRQDHTAIFTAARHAGEAYEFILAHGQARDQNSSEDVPPQ